MLTLRTSQRSFNVQSRNFLFGLGTGLPSSLHINFTKPLFACLIILSPLRSDRFLSALGYVCLFCILVPPQFAGNSPTLSNRVLVLCREVQQAQYFRVEGILYCLYLLLQYTFRVESQGENLLDLYTLWS